MAVVAAAAAAAVAAVAVVVAVVMVVVVENGHLACLRVLGKRGHGGLTSTKIVLTNAFMACHLICHPRAWEAHH